MKRDAMVKDTVTAAAMGNMDMTLKNQGSGR
jgi:hypothetical protein